MGSPRLDILNPLRENDRANTVLGQVAPLVAAVGNLT